MSERDMATAIATDATNEIATRLSVPGGLSVDDRMDVHGIIQEHAARLLRLSPERQGTWTKERPTKPGWYWQRYGSDLRITEVRIDDGVAVEFYYGEKIHWDGSTEASGTWRPVSDAWEWSGPIPVPEE